MLQICFLKFKIFMQYHQWLQWKPTTTRLRGRPWKRWLDNIMEVMERRNYTTGGGVFKIVSGQRWKGILIDKP